ncbi:MULTISPECIES: ribosome recycling factor [unclassified Mycoplasma]|uniref:ribosome recycling factor n=1 Tax=unclassified Mycoplasma TaxID=2683645 RepID=UPI00211C6DB3|nr:MULTISPECIES: ribosome recycling factor [unclassified Mycoplasma]UUM19844.1 ribosome recycling factor [Mycoplasma sp. 1578d]UUM24828.1 ribosome recycling factor [Mycoplasma sp. 3686d]
MEIGLYLLDLEEKCEKAIHHYRFEMSKISTGRANPQIVKGIRVEYYGTPTPLEELANISVPEAQQLLIKPYDITSVKEVNKALMNANLGVTPIDEGHQVRLNFPVLTTQRKNEIIKSLSKFSEQAKVGVRNARQEINKQIKADDELSEDMQKNYLDQVQSFVDKQIEKINALTKEKEEQILKI